jgi:hypothetical protein
MYDLSKFFFVSVKSHSFLTRENYLLTDKVGETTIGACFL